MKFYQYKAVDSKGKRYEGYMRVQSKDALVAWVCSQGLQLISVGRVWWKVQPRLEFLLEFFFQLEQMLVAGLPLVQALKMIGEGDMAQSRFVSPLVTGIESGLLFSQALREHDAEFDGVIMSLVEISERTGRMAECLRECVSYLRWLLSIQDRFRRATRYPLLILVVMVFAMGTLMVVLVPPMVEFMEVFGHGVPLTTRLLVAGAEFLVIYWFPLMMTMVGGMLGVWFSVKRSSWLRGISHIVLFTLPVIGSLMQDIMWSRYFHALGYMYQHRVDLLHGLRVAGANQIHPGWRAKLEDVCSNVEMGLLLSDALAKPPGVPVIVVRMVKVGEISGNLVSTFGHLKFYFDRRVEQRFEKLVTYTEPILMLLVGLFLLLIVYAVFWPIYAMTTMAEL